MAKSVQKSLAISLRSKGRSIKEIARITNVSVASVSAWCRNVTLTPKQIEILQNHSRDPLYGKRMTYINKIKENKDRKIVELNKIGQKEIGFLSRRELFLVGCALYWGEGFKKDNQVGFANTDPHMIKIFIKWLKNCFGYKNNDFTLRVTLNISHKERIDEVQKYWSEVTNISKEQFRKPFFQNFTWKKIYNNPQDYHGVLRIKVNKSIDFLRKIYGYIDGLKKNSV